MKNDSEPWEFTAPRKFAAFIKKLLPVSISKRAALVWAGAFLVCFLVVFINIDSSRELGGSIEEFEVGKVADRDVTADQAIVYEDEKATRLRYEAQERLVPAVFYFSDKASEDIKNQWDRFMVIAGSLGEEEHSQDAFRRALQSVFPENFPDDVIELLYRSDARSVIFLDATVILNMILERGIYSVPQSGLEHLNPDVVEVIRQSGSRAEKERVPWLNIITRATIPDAVRGYTSTGSFPPQFAQIVPGLLSLFLKENVFYSSEDTLQSITETRAKTEPVMRNIEPGSRIIKRGFIVTEEDMTELRALRMTLPDNDLPIIFADLLFLLLLFGLLCYFCGSRIIGRNLTDRETYLVAGLSALYIAGSIIIRNVSVEYIPASVMIPTALIMMLPSILIHSRLALVLAMSLPLGAFLTGSFDTSSYIFALVSGVVATYSLQGAEKRMDLDKAGLFIAAANLVAIVAVLLWQRSPAGAYPRSIFWAAFNGIACGMLVLGVLSPLEHALNAATAFRLIELSDLNAPVLRRLFTAAPGTYSHSIMVANLAEAACLDIGANSLLARVGAYYHDLGKMENPDYFVENQADYNRHDDIAPRLSATILRSHVKMGVEKARQLALPQEVIDIIGEHHGNSVITWFYSKALKQEGGDSRRPVNIEDFTYPGSPPRSRESAVVMLADMTEAAVRTLDKPTAVKIEKFTQELIANKVEHGQLAQSELTFRDLETIKKAFVRVLAGYYHSRIEYPKINEPKDNGDAPASETNGAAEK